MSQETPLPTPLHELAQAELHEQLELWLDASRAQDHARRLRGAVPVDLMQLIAHAKTPETLAAELKQIQIVPVLTSHPSEIRPQAVLAALANSDDEETAFVHLRTTQPRVQLERPTVAKEVETLLGHFKRVLFEAIPDFYEALESAAIARFGSTAPTIPTLLSFHSWVGCDRDGNPECTAAATLAAAESMHRCIVDRYRCDLLQLIEISDGPLAADFQQLHDTLEIVDHVATISAAAFAAELERMSELDLSVASRKLLTRLRRRYATFGFHLATLEWRQHSDYILYTFDEREHVLHPERRHFAELDSHFQLARLHESFHDGIHFRDYDQLLVTSKAVEVMQSLRVLGEIRRRYGAAAVGELIISNCEEIIVVLALERLARDAGVFDCGELQIVPLFESISALERGPQMLQTLLAEPQIRNKISRLHDRFEIMVGYSDAAKDGGRIAADIMIADTQRRLIDACQMHGVTPHIFHGRGGSFGRGYATFAEATQTADKRIPPGEIKITEQGEVVANRYGHPRFAAHTIRSWFCQALSALRDNGEITHTTLEVDLNALEQRVAKHGNLMFRGLREEASFMASVRILTELDIVREFPLSSRPASRSEGWQTMTDLASLRAVPFNMAFNLVFAQIPAWFGTGSALEEEMQRSGTSLLQYAYLHRPLFRTTIDLTCAALEATNLNIMRERSIDKHQERFFAQIAQEEERTRTILGEITGEAPQVCSLTTQLPHITMILHFLQTQAEHTDAYAAYLALATIAATIGMTG